ncbi:MAG: EamA/RhaT family transporter [Betaproteobacteria bacterium]
MTVHEWTWLWIPASIFAAAAQAGRNAIQRSLTEQLGTLGATQVRFLYGFPFAFLFTLIAIFVTGSVLPKMNLEFALFVLAGALSQIAATALMLAAMRQRAFVVVTAWTKTEPVQVALFGMIVLGDQISLLAMGAIIVATVGVTVMASKPASGGDSGPAWQPVVLGLSAAACFAIAAVSFRGGILALGEAHFFVRASWTLTCGLGLQTVLLAAWMMTFHYEAWVRCLKAWRISIWGGLLGASASQGWFLGFALTAAANVRTLGLVEVLFAQLLSWRVFLSKSTRRETLGIVLIVAGVACLLLTMP